MCEGSRSYRQKLYEHVNVIAEILMIRQFLVLQKPDSIARKLNFQTASPGLHHISPLR